MKWIPHIVIGIAILVLVLTIASEQPEQTLIIDTPESYVDCCTFMHNDEVRTCTAKPEFCDLCEQVC